MAEFDLVDAQARLAAIVQSSDDAIVSKTLDGVVVTWNQGAERIFGYTADEMIGRPLAVIIPPERAGEEPEILRRLRAGELVDHFETVRVHKDGHPVNVSVTISPIRNAAGRVVGASKIARDITAQKQAERQLREAKESAETAARAKDRFLSVLSHELRTPLTPALVAINYIEDHAVALPAELREQVAMVRRNVETEARLVDDLLDHTGITRGKIRLHLETVDAHAAVRTAVGAFGREVDEKALVVTVAPQARRHHVRADPGRFQQVLLNLLSNAVKFTPERGSIAVRTTDEPDGRLGIEVTDTGIGIPPLALPNVFTAFEQGDANVTRLFGGLGLGLSIVKSLVEMHGGQVEAHSEGTDRGATFRVRMPTVPRPAETAAARADQDTDRRAGSPGARRTVLLVEDHADTRKVMTTLLRSFGCAVTAAAGVREAIAASDQQSFDLLLSDIGLPDGTGMDIIRHMFANGQPVRGIAISGFGQDSDLRRSREAGFATHLIKPISVQVLREAVLGEAKPVDQA